MALSTVTLLGRFTASLVAWLVSGLLVCALICYLVAFSTIGWATSQASANITISYGLWTRCTSQLSVTLCHSLHGNEISGIYEAAQAFSVLTLVLLVGAVVFQATYIFITRFNNDQRTAAAVLACSLATALTAIVLSGLIVAAIDYDVDQLFPDWPSSITHVMSYSFGLNIVSLLLAGAVAGLMAYEIRENSELIPA